MELTKTEWKRLEERFAQNVRSAYKGIWKTLVIKCDDDELTDLCRSLEDIATKYSADVDDVRDENDERLMRQLPRNKGDVGFHGRMTDWLRGQSLGKLIRRHIEGLREIKVLNKIIANELIQVARRSRDARPEGRVDSLKQQMEELARIIKLQSSVIACIDHKVEEQHKLNKKMRLLMFRMVSCTSKVLKSFSISSSDEVCRKPCEERDDHVTGEYVTLNTDDEPIRKTPLHNDVGETTRKRDSPQAGDFPKVRVIYVMPRPTTRENNGDKETDLRKPIDCDVSENEHSPNEDDISILDLETGSPHQSPSPRTMPTPEESLKLHMNNTVPGGLVHYHVGQIETSAANMHSAVKSAWGQTAGIRTTATGLTTPFNMQYNVYVRVVKPYIAKNKYELSLKVGDILKQKAPAGPTGFAYGWTRSHRLAPKRTGVFPLDCVELRESKFA